jgi:ribosome biogenesis GTPase
VRTGALSTAGGRGTDTTTVTTPYLLPGGGNLIDSPGVWEFGPPITAPEQLERGFVEFRPHLGRCRFANCRHLVEPGCAIAAAVAGGAITARRLATYRELVAESGARPGE